MNRSTWTLALVIAVLGLTLIAVHPLAARADDPKPPSGGAAPPAGGATPAPGGDAATGEAAAGAQPCEERVCRTPGCRCAPNMNNNAHVEITVTRPERQPLRLAPGATFQIEIRVNAAGDGLMWSASHGAERDRHEDPRNIGPEGDPKQDPERLEDGRTRLVFERRAPQQPGTYWVHLVGSRLQQCCNPVGFASVAVQIEVVAPEPEKKLGALQGPTLDGLRNVRRSFESAGRSTTTVPTVIDPDPASSVPRLVIPQPARAVRHRAEPMAAMPAAPTAVMAPAMPIERPGTTVLGPGPDASPAATPARIVVPGSGARGVLTPVAPAPAVTTPKTTGTPPAATGATPATILVPGRARVDVRGGIGLGPATPTTLPPASGGRLLR